jgi:dipeptidyl aminopeptidase/acylaminoacyl peptidase
MFRHPDFGDAMLSSRRPLFVTALLALGIRVDAQAPAKRTLAIEDYYRFKTVSAPELSPDGRWVAFTVGTRIEENNGLLSEVWVVPFDASAPAQRVSPERANTVAPAWTSDGRLRFITGGRTLTVEPANPERVDSSTVRSNRTAPQTSSDGKWVASVRDTPPPARSRVYASDFERRHEERFKGVQYDWMEFHRDGGPFPLPNATDPQVNPPQEIFIASAGDDDKSARQLTHLAVRPAGLQWSPDGTTLLFSVDSSYRNEHVYGRTDIFTATLDGKVRPLTPSTEYDYNGARYSPDGKWILASRQLSTDATIAKKLTHGASIELVVLPANGGAERVLTADWDYIPTNAQWSADGQFIYFAGGVGGTGHLFRVPVSGGAVQQVTSGQRRLAGFSFDKTFAKMSYSVGTFDAPSELWGANMDGSGEHQLTHVNDDLVGELALSRAERLQFKSADGTPVEGWLTFPSGYRAGAGKYPLVVSNHGGPHSAIEYGLNFKNQYLAANGYFVLEVNFRSSTNYGEKFLWATWGAWGTKDGQDVMAGIDHVIAKYPIDKSKVATIGHSYGGFMTNWLITQYPDRFAAAIPGAGIVNWTSDYGNADIPRTKETEFFGGPWDAKARDIMIKQSPLTYADRAKAPTLFINGEVDQRVPVSEAQQMFVALKKHGVPAKMIQYAGQPHGIAGSWNIVHRMLNEREWLDRWLKEARSPLP